MTPTSEPVGRIAETNPSRHSPRPHRISERNPANRPKLTGSALGGAGVRHTCEPKRLRRRCKGKAPKLALTALMRKMLVTLNAMLKARQVWKQPSEA